MASTSNDPGTHLFQKWERGYTSTEQGPMQVAGPSCGVSSYPPGKLPGRPRQDTQLAKRGFEHFKINNIPIITIVTKFITPVCWSRSCLRRHVQMHIQNPIFTWGLLWQICWKLHCVSFCYRQFGPNSGFWEWKVGTIHTPPIVDSSLVHVN